MRGVSSTTVTYGPHSTIDKTDSNPRRHNDGLPPGQFQLTNWANRVANFGGHNTFRPAAIEETESDSDFEELLSDVHIGNATREHINTYVCCGPEVMPPEAFSEWHQNPDDLEEGFRPVKGGCKGMQAEYATTGVEWLLYRQFTHSLIKAVERQTRKIVKLDGPAGAHGLLVKVWLVLVEGWCCCPVWLMLHTRRPMVCLS